MSARIIRSLPCWRGPIELEPIPGGMSNRNYRVRDGRRSYVVRLSKPLPHLGIDRRNELLCHQAAWACGVAPAVFHHQAGVLVSEHVQGRTLTSAEVRRPQVLERLARTLKRLHGSWDRLAGELLYFSPFQAVRTYAATARRLGAWLPADLDRLLEDARRLSRLLSPFHPALCHNDLLAANLIDGGRRLWLVDWEYAGIGNPLFDLAGVSGNCALTPELEKTLLRAYFERLSRKILCELRILKTVSLLREALWGLIQTRASDLDFDYVKYAGDNFAAYKNARKQLEC
ncbi:MAG: phosphotransferase [Planctomycetes bacterium]|nr:phosphotransferase [Planctomycetota bacterium]